MPWIALIGLAWVALIVAGNWQRLMDHLVEKHTAEWKQAIIEQHKLDIKNAEAVRLRDVSASLDQARIQAEGLAKNLHRSVADRHERQLEEATKTAARIIDQYSRVGFDRSTDGSYCVNVVIDRRLLWSCHYMRHDYEFIAHRISEQVRREIASGKFIESGHDTARRREMEEYERRAIAHPYTKF